MIWFVAGWVAGVACSFGWAAIVVHHHRRGAPVNQLDALRRIARRD